MLAIVDNKAILTATSGFLERDYTHTINAYSGCGFACAVCGGYCYAQQNGFVTKGRKWALYGVKRDTKDAYVREYHRLKRPKRGGPEPLRIFMSSSTDPYTPQEKTACVTEGLLTEMLLRPPDLLVIQTHSLLVARDIQYLFRRLAQVGYLCRVRDSMQSLPSWLFVGFETPFVAVLMQVENTMIEKAQEIAYGNERLTMPRLDLADRPTENSGMERDESFLFHNVSEYLDRGWPVIPVTGKRPAIPTWKEFQSRRPTREEFGAWFGGENPRHTNVGIVTGRVSGLVIIDCDRPEDTKYWLDNYPRSPLMVRTGGGGMHVYYQMPPNDNIGNRVGIHSRSIDLRGEGGYVVAPPSRHTNGNLYAWTQWGDYRLRDVPVFDPTWVHNTDESSGRGQVISDATGFNAHIRHGRAYISHIHAVCGHGGHNATYRAACKLRDAGLTREEALAELLVWNESNAYPPWSVKELTHKIDDAFRLLRRVNSERS